MTTKQNAARGLKAFLISYLIENGIEFNESDVHSFTWKWVDQAFKTPGISNHLMDEAIKLKNENEN